MNWPSLSIIIPTFNRAKYLERALLSIIKQKYEGQVQIVVADGGSTDGTVALLKKYPQILWWSEPDNGPLDAMLKGLDKATGELLTTLPDDDFYLKNAFRKSIQHLRDRPDIAFVSGGLLYLKENGIHVSRGKLSNCVINDPYAYLSGAVEIPLQCSFIRRTAFDSAGGFRLRAAHCSDVDLLYRLLHISKGLAIPEYLGVFQVHSGQQTRSNPAAWIECFKTTIEDCERDARFAHAFKLTEQEKAELYLKSRIFWLSYCGTEQERMDARNLAAAIRSDRMSYSKQLVLFAEDVLTKNAPLWKKGIVALRNGCLTPRLLATLWTYLPSRHIYDLDWWKT